MEDLLQHLVVHRHTIDKAMAVVCQETAPLVMGMIQLHLDGEESNDDPLLRKTCFQCLSYLNNHYGSIPASIHLADVVKEGAHPLTSGGYAVRKDANFYSINTGSSWRPFKDIWKGRVADKQMVCLKVLRVYTGSYDERKLRRQLGDEVLIWRQLRHPNIHQFLGITAELFRPSYCIVSPWMSNGDLMHYTRERQVSLEDKVKMMQEISIAIRYLHEHHPPIIHGDIKGINILVSDDGHCLLNDFGLATIEGDLSQGHTDPAVIRGSVPWLAPELMSPDPVDIQNQTARDIYALGCTIFELLTGNAPFSEKKREPQIIVAVLHGFRPERPASTICPDPLWAIIEGCWEEDARKRLGASEVVCRLGQMRSRHEVLVSSRRTKRITTFAITHFDNSSSAPTPEQVAHLSSPGHTLHIEHPVGSPSEPMGIMTVPPARPKSPTPPAIRRSVEGLFTIGPGGQTIESLLAEGLDWFLDEEENELSQWCDSLFLRHAWYQFQDRVGR
ncbi:hypothetical protein V5O48_011031 [Marasmius crinis-equi]|uniref:Protein kinase domain-containing protein n=1 Tax=Marasmius crinis-equi TaxID=585013 RepID=A0ABR3F6Q5_9AGAR